MWVCVSLKKQPSGKLLLDPKFGRALSENMKDKGIELSQIAEFMFCVYLLSKTKI